MCCYQYVNPKPSKYLYNISISVPVSVCAFGLLLVNAFSPLAECRGLVKEFEEAGGRLVALVLLRPFMFPVLLFQTMDLSKMGLTRLPV